MSTDKSIKRRGFVKVCAGMAVSISQHPSQLFANDQPHQSYNRVRLVNTDGEPLTLESVRAGQSYIFSYPFPETPCFLLNLGQSAKSTDGLNTADGRAYQSAVAIGENKSLVAYAAICTHKLTHPAKAISFINFSAAETNYLDQEAESKSKANIIFCCSERSAYDPSQGGRVLGGPAIEPLTSIVLEHDAKDGTIYATGTIGGGIFDRFFEKFGPRLLLEYGSEDFKLPVEGDRVVQTIEDYSATLKSC